jgi:hypothetical protein
VAAKSGSTARTGGRRRRRVIGGRKSGACDDPLDAAASARSVAHDYHRQTGYPTQVIADEAQDGMLPDGDVEADNPVKRMLHEDRDKALKVQVATQDPQDLEYTPLKQCRYWVWVGEWSTFHRGFINYFDLPKSELPTEPYQVVVFDKRMTCCTGPKRRRSTHDPLSVLSDPVVRSRRGNAASGLRAPAASRRCDGTSRAHPNEQQGTAAERDGVAWL